MANETRAPRERLRRRQLRAQQQQQQNQHQQPPDVVWGFDPAFQARLMLATPTDGGQRLFFVSRDAAEHMRQAVVLRRYHQLLQERQQAQAQAEREVRDAAAGGGSSGSGIRSNQQGSSRQGQQPGSDQALSAHQPPGHALRQTWQQRELESTVQQDRGGQASSSGSTGSGSTNKWRWPWQWADQRDSGSGPSADAAPNTPPVFDPLAPWLEPKAGEHPTSQQKPSSAATAPTPVDSKSSGGSVASAGGSASTGSASSAVAPVQTWRQLLDSVVVDLKQLEEEAVLQEGAALAAAAGAEAAAGGTSRRGARWRWGAGGQRGEGAATEQAPPPSSPSLSQQQRPHGALRSYVARVPLDAALHALCGDPGRHNLVVFEGDVRAAEAAAGRHSAINLRGSSSSRWHLEIEESSSDADEDEDGENSGASSDGRAPGDAEAAALLAVARARAEAARAERGRRRAAGSAGAPVAAAAAAGGGGEEAREGRSLNGVVLSFTDADFGTCNRTPVFKLPGLKLLLRTQAGDEVAFQPAFMSLRQLHSFLDSSRRMFECVWAQQRRESRRAWRLAVETSAAELAGLALPPGGAAAAAAAAWAARRAREQQEEDEEDEDGMGDPPEAKALLEELGQRQPSTAAAAAAAARGAPLPPPRGVVGALNTLALGMISLAAAGAAAAGDAADAAALRVPALSPLVTGVPSRVNVEAGFLEDFAGDAAEHNAALTQQRGGGGSGGRGSNDQKRDALSPWPSSGGPQLGAVQGGEGEAGSSGFAANGSAGSAAIGRGIPPIGGSPEQQHHQQQQQQQGEVAPPPGSLELESIEGLRLVLAAGWAIAHDARRSDGRLANAVLSHHKRQVASAAAAAAAAAGAGAAGGGAGGQGAGSNARVAMTDDGEIAVRLELEVAERQHPSRGLLQLPPPPAAAAAAAVAAAAAAAAAASGAAPRQSPRHSAMSSPPLRPGAGAAAPGFQTALHRFEVGIHLNLSRLVADPGSQHPDALTVESGGPGSAAMGLLLIGDLGLAGGGGGALEDEEEDGWDGLRPPPLGFRALPLGRGRQQRAPGGSGAAGGAG